MRTIEAGRQKLALAFSLAASLAVFALSWWAWPQLPTANNPTHRHVDTYALKRDKKLAPFATAPLRAGALADLADDFFTEVRQKAHDPARLTVLAVHFDRLFRDDLMKQVRLVEPGQRKAVASSIALRLSHVESEASRLASEWAPHHARSASVVRRIAASAREADRKLRSLV